MRSQHFSERCGIVRVYHSVLEGERSRRKGCEVSGFSCQISRNSPQVENNEGIQPVNSEQKVTNSNSRFSSKGQINNDFISRAK